MENNKIFLTISRVNSVLFLILLIVSLIGVVFIFQGLTKNTRRNAIEKAITSAAFDLRSLSPAIMSIEMKAIIAVFFMLPMCALSESRVVSEEEINR